MRYWFIKLKSPKEFNLRMILTKAFFIFNYIPDAIYYKDDSNNILKVNDYYCQLVGRTKSEIENHSGFEISPKKLAQKYWNYDLEVIKNKEAKIDTEEKWNTKSGMIYVLCSRIPIEDQKGNITGILGIAKDINKRKIAEQKLRESEEQFRTISEQSIMGICVIQDNQVKYLNNTLAKILGYTTKEILSWDLADIREILYPDDRPIVIKELMKKPNGKKDVLENYQYRIIKKNGMIAWLNNFSKSINYKGKFANLITVVDITENKMAQEELISLNKLRSELLSRTSHELKTPLVMIKGYSELLREKNKSLLSKESIEMLDIIDDGVAKLKRIIEQIMDASKVKAKKLKINKVSNNLSILIEYAVKELEGILKLRKHNLKLYLEENLIIEFDRNGIFQVLLNIISNAIKFTPPNGNIIIKTQKTEEEITVSVQDDGIGFEEDEKTYLFTEFGKVERFGEDVDIPVKGSGLGLYISKNIIDLHGGKIWMRSEGRNMGSTFFFSLPLTAKNIIA